MTAEAASTVAAVLYPVGCIIAALRVAGHSTARVAVCAERHRTTDHPHVTPWSYHAGTTIHWLPIWERVKFKVACLVRQSLSGQAPFYLVDDCYLVPDSTRRSLRSADVLTCVVPRTFSSYDDRSFTVAGPRLWNSLPVQLCTLDITDGLFRRQLKGHLFSEPWTRRFVTSDTWRLNRKTLTYFLTLDRSFASRQIGSKIGSKQQSLWNRKWNEAAWRLTSEIPISHPTHR